MATYYIEDGESNSGIILEYDEMFVRSGGTAINTTINTSGYLEVASGGTSIDTIINDRKSGGLFITPGGVANGATVNYGGYMRIQPDGKAKNVVENGGYVYVDEELEKGTPNVAFKKNSFSGVVLSGYDSEKKRKATVHSGTTANDTTVDSGSVLEILGGIANGNTVNSGGDMIVFSGTANNTVVNSGGYLCISSGAVVNGTTVNSGGEMVVSGGTANNTVVNSDGYVGISSGGVANSATINDGDTGGLFVFDGGVANDVTVNSGGYVKIFSDGKAKNIVENGGYVYIVDELENGHPNVTFKKNSFSGVVLYDEKRKASVHSGTTAFDTTVDSDGTFSVLGGIANGTTINFGGEMYVHSGTANNTVVNSGGYLEISSDGKATGITENGGYVSIADEEEYVEHPNVTFLPNSFTGLVLNGTSASVHSGTTANAAAVGDGGLLCVFSSGFANGVTVDPGGELWIYSGGLANGILLGTGGELIVGYGGWITGRITFEPGALVSSANEAILDFDLRQTAPGEAALVNDLSFIPNSFLFTITVDGTQPNGTYKLAGGATAFDQTVSVIGVSGNTFGTIAVGGTLSTAMADYTLKKSGSDLTLEVVSKMIENGPEEPYNNDLLCKDKTVNRKVTDSYGTHLSAGDDEVRLDKIGTVDRIIEDVVYNNRVEKEVDKTGDKIDYAKIVLAKGAMLSFHAEATAAAKFTVYSLTLNPKNGKYKMKKLQTLKLADKDKDGVFTADSKKQVGFQAAGEYYVSMQFADKKAEEAFYNVKLNGADRNKFFLDDDNGENNWLYDSGQKTWNEKVTKSDAFGLSRLVTAVQIDTDSETVISHKVGDTTYTNFVGFGDAMDFRRIELFTAAKLGFDVDLVGGAGKLFLYRIDEKGKVKTVTNQEFKASGTTNKAVVLDKGVYYLAMQSTNAKKGDEVYYNIAISDRSAFFTDGDTHANDYDGKAKSVGSAVMGFTAKLETGKSLQIDGVLSADSAIVIDYKGFTNFVGCNDESDVIRIKAAAGDSVSLKITAMDAVTLSVYGLKNGKVTALKSVKIKAAGDATLDYKFQEKDGTAFFVGVESPNAKKGGAGWYNVEVVSFDAAPAASLDFAASDALAMPETDSLGISDSLSFGSCGTDALADVSAAFLAELDDKCAWQDLALA